MHRFQEFDALIAAVVALAVTLATCWLLGSVVPPAVAKTLAPTAQQVESDWVY